MVDEEGCAVEGPTDHLVGCGVVDQLPELGQERGHVGRGPADGWTLSHLRLIPTTQDDFLGLRILQLFFHLPSLEVRIGTTCGEHGRTPTPN